MELTTNAKCHEISKLIMVKSKMTCIGILDGNESEFDQQFDTNKF